MDIKHSEIRQDVERARDELASKASELSHRAAAAANNLRLSHQIEERPFTMLALSIVAGFAVEKIFFGRRDKVIVMREEEAPPPRRKRKRRRKLEKMVERAELMKERRAESERRGEGVEDDETAREDSGPMRAVMAMGQMAAGALAREVATRLMHRAPDEPQVPRA